MPPTGRAAGAGGGGWEGQVGLFANNLNHHHYKIILNSKWTKAELRLNVWDLQLEMTLKEYKDIRIGQS